MNEQLTTANIEALIKAVAANGIGELCYETESVKLCIRGAAAAPPQAVPASSPATAVAVATATASQQEKLQGCVLTSPLVGTFYAASAPDNPPFVQPGQRVRKGETVCIVESMKVMNEIPAEQDGVVAEILVENGAPVEYGQPLIRMEGE